jgi:hypothetical protein
VLLSMVTVFLIDFITAIGGCQECHVQLALVHQYAAHRQDVPCNIR